MKTSVNLKNILYEYFEYYLVFLFLCLVKLFFYSECGNFKHYNCLSCLTHSLQIMSGYNLDLKSEMNKTRKLPLMKDTRASDSSQEETTDQWARRRKQFKDSKKCSSTGGSSINSTITEGSSEYFSLMTIFFLLHVKDILTGFSAKEIDLQFIT